LIFKRNFHPRKKLIKNWFGGIKLLEDLKNLSKDIKIEILIHLIQDYAQNYVERSFSLPELIGELKKRNKNLYKYYDDLIATDFFMQEEEKTLKLNLSNELIKELVTIEVFKGQGFSNHEFSIKELLNVIKRESRKKLREISDASSAKKKKISFMVSPEEEKLLLLLKKRSQKPVNELLREALMDKIILEEQVQKYIKTQE